MRRVEDERLREYLLEMRVPDRGVVGSTSVRGLVGGGVAVLVLVALGAGCGCAEAVVGRGQARGIGYVVLRL